MANFVIFLIVGFVALLGFNVFLRGLARQRRQSYIDRYAFPKKLNEQLRQTYPHLSTSQLQQVDEALRDYFHMCNIAGKQSLAMPSQAVDVAWHEFILFTKHYQLFCRHALGRFLHHTPAEAMPSQTYAQEGIKRAWRIACTREGINPLEPDRLPRIFAIDGLLSIPNGFVYTADKEACRQGHAYCGADIGCSSSCASGSDSDGCSSGCSSGCGGD